MPLSENIDNLILYVLLALVVLIIFALVLLSYLEGKKEKEYADTIKNQSNTIRIFKLDIQSGTVIYFNTSSISEKKKIALTEFYNEFATSDRDKLINWISDLADVNKKEEVAKYLEIDVYLRKIKKNYFSMLQVSQVDYNKQIIHLESYLLKYISPSGKNKNSALSTRDEIDKAISLSSPFKGVTIDFHFSYAKSKNNKIDSVIFAHLVDAIYPFTGQSCLIAQASDNDIILFDFKLASYSMTMYLIKSIINSIKKFLGISGIGEQIAISVGVVENKNFPHYADKLFQEATKMALIALEEKEQIVWYEKGMKIADPNDATYRTEVERIIKDKKLKYQFRPIFSVDEEKVIGYQSFVKPFDTFFDSISELKEYATRTEDDKELFATIARNTIPLFVAENSDASSHLFFEIAMSEKVLALNTLTKIPNVNKANLVLCFDEEDIGSYKTTNGDSFAEDLTGFKDRGFEIALVLKDNTLLLKSSLYEQFDFFIVDIGVTGTSTNNNRERFQMISLVEKLLKYQKPIIANNLPNWESIELMVRSGLKYIGSEVFTPSDEMLLPIAKKNLQKIINMKS